jgi:putative addiction module component (TIGR02574 family)
MNLNYEQVLQAAVGLGDSERVNLIDSLIQTLADADAVPLDDTWLAEIDRRSNEIDEGKVELIPWEEVKRRARQRVGLPSE